MDELDGLRAAARLARGSQRASIIQRLADLDRELLDDVAAGLDEASAASYRREAVSELAPFAARMAPDVLGRAEEAAFRRLVRDGTGLPTLAFE
jgi:hypothetical protein